MDGAVQSVYLKGQGLKADGSLGKYARSRKLFGSNIPDWAQELLDITL
jgi:hypothetical protein